MKILVIDNYDSFVYNLVHYLEEFDCSVTVRRNDEIILEEIKEFDKILLSPGPGLPSDAAILKIVIESFSSTKSILGVCLGQQAIAEVFGGKLENLNEVHHGESTTARLLVKNESLFDNMSDEFEIGRYHSWVVSRDNFPDCLEITSEDDNGQIMSLRHRVYDVKGVQFHPESILTPKGKQLISNWINH